MDYTFFSRSKRILELDGLRAFSVIFVVINHMYSFSGSLPRGSYWLAPIVECLGPIGVHVFFVISGFIITTLLVRERTTAGRVSLRDFYIRRFFRIVPPFAIYLLVLFVLRTFGWILISNNDLLCSLLFLGNTGQLDLQGWFVAHTWSLSVEEQFYLLFPPLLCVLGFRTRATFVVLCVFYGLCVLSLKIGSTLALSVSPQWISINILYQFRYIIVGVALALYGRAVLALLTKTARVVPLAFFILLISLNIYLIDPVSTLITVLVDTIEPCICGLFVMWFIQNPSKCKSLRWPVVQWVGSCSYSIYLWQQLFTGSMSNYRDWALPQSPLSVIAIIICAAISFYLIEQPCIRLGRFISKQKGSLKVVILGQEKNLVNDESKKSG